jgi:hypothetical protein
LASDWIHSDDDPISDGEVQLYDVRRASAGNSTAFNTTLTINCLDTNTEDAMDVEEDGGEDDNEGYVSDEEAQLEYILIPDQPPVLPHSCLTIGSPNFKV